MVAEHDGEIVAQWPLAEEPREFGSTETHLVPQWSQGQPTHTISTDLTFTPTPSSVHVIQHPNRVEITQPGVLNVSRAACDEAERALGVVPRCEGLGTLRLVLARVEASDFEPKRDVSGFSGGSQEGYRTRAREVSIYYFAPDADPDFVAAVRAVESQIAAVLPGFEVRENQCSRAALETVPRAVRPGELIAQCQGLEETWPSDFVWAKRGGLRFNTISEASFSTTPGWGTLAARAVDPKTGEILAADLLVNKNALGLIEGQIRDRHNDVQLIARVILARDSALRRASGSTAPGVMPDAPRVDRTPAGLRTRMVALRAQQADGLAENTGYRELMAGPDGADLVDGQLTQLDVRVDAILAMQDRDAAAKWMRGGHSFLEQWMHPGYGVRDQITGMSPSESARLLVRGVTEHRLMHGLLKSMGLADYPAGSWQDQASVLDTMPAELQPSLVQLGAYDRAALRNLYLDEPSPQAWLPCTIEAALLQPTLACALDDSGGSARASVAHAYARWAGQQRITHRVDPITGFFDKQAAVRPALSVFWRASIAAQQWLARTREDPSFPESEEGLDYAAAARMGANFGGEVIAAPSAGRYCSTGLVGSSGLVGYIEPYPGLCDSSIPVDSPEGQAQGQIEVLPNAGSHDESGRLDPSPGWASVGSHLDKSVALWALQLAFPSGGSAPTKISLVDFVPEAGGLYDELVDSGLVVSDAYAGMLMGARWCGKVVPRTVVDTGLRPQAFDCEEPGAGMLLPWLTGEHRLNALFLRQFQGPSKVLRLYKAGEDAMSAAWSRATEGERCEVVGPDGQAWRALSFEDPIACEMIVDAQRVAGHVERGTIPAAIYERTLAAVADAHRLARALGQ